jgi:hypothetical protein
MATLVTVLGSEEDQVYLHKVSLILQDWESVYDLSQWKDLRLSTVVGAWEKALVEFSERYGQRYAEYLNGCSYQLDFDEEVFPWWLEPEHIVSELKHTSKRLCARSPKR